ncbi:helix-turn-helix domain-containing protein [Embleya sp. NBC_00888]|uniref:helix-turn-helix domain-containing protein n=1 Tax=Embleya sp. NBC_00888 TaxID=2975960 RepID=UPI0038678525|nr:helix-turn-helix domain-containing protein [Embleya sp. NBC_00888]
MRYAQGGGLTPKERAARERLRLDAAERFERGESNAVIASELRVARRSVERWRRAWREAGVEGLRSSGPASVPRLDPSQMAALEGELDRGLTAHGWQDQRWTSVRVGQWQSCDGMRPRRATFVRCANVAAPWCGHHGVAGTGRGGPGVADHAGEGSTLTTDPPRRARARVTSPSPYPRSRMRRPPGRRAVRRAGRLWRMRAVRNRSAPARHTSRRSFPMSRSSKPLRWWPTIRQPTGIEESANPSGGCLIVGISPRERQTSA